MVVTWEIQSLSLIARPWHQGVMRSDSALGPQGPTYLDCSCHFGLSFVSAGLPHDLQLKIEDSLEALQGAYLKNLRRLLVRVGLDILWTLTTSF